MILNNNYLKELLYNCFDKNRETMSPNILTNGNEMGKFISLRLLFLITIYHTKNGIFTS